jgi:hypothetical protein
LYPVKPANAAGTAWAKERRWTIAREDAPPSPDSGLSPSPKEIPCCCRFHHFTIRSKKSITILAPATLPTTLPTTTGVDGADDLSVTSPRPAMAVAVAMEGPAPGMPPGNPAMVTRAVSDDVLGE